MLSPYSNTLVEVRGYTVTLLHLLSSLVACCLLTIRVAGPFHVTVVWCLTLYRRYPESRDQRKIWIVLFVMYSNSSVHVSERTS